MKAVISYLLVCLSLVFQTMVALAQPSSSLDLTPDRTHVPLAAMMRYAADNGEASDEIIRRFEVGEMTGDFEAVGANVRPYQAIWGVVALRRPLDDTNEPVVWHLASDIYGLIALDVLLVGEDGKAQQLLDHDIRTSFNPSEYAFSRLRSAPLMLSPGDQAHLVVKVVHGAMEEVRLSLEQPERLQAEGAASAMRVTAFYAFLGSCLLFFFVFSIALRSEVEFAYGVLLLLGLGFVAYLDNFPFRWLYPNQPELHLPVGLIALLAVIAQGFFAAGLSLRRYSSRMGVGKWLSGAALGTILLVPAVFLLTPELLAPLTYGLFALMLASQVYSVFQWDAYGGARRRVVHWVTLVTVAGMSAIVLLALARSGIEGMSIPWFIKGVYTTLAFGVMAGLSIGVIEMRREHADAQTRELDAVRKEAAATRDLLQAEQNYIEAREVADRRQLQLASLSHDIKQPLSALRMSVEGMTRGDPAATRERLQEAFDYIEELTLSHLEDVRSDVQECQASDEDDTQTAPYALSLILDTVGQMFGEEARAKGLELRLVPSGAQVAVQPLALMRIVSNLVSNAVKYTGNGKVLVGARRNGGKAVLQVLDTGPGMSKEELARFQIAWQSGQDSEGHGLGLAICASLAGQTGISLEVESELGRGTVFSVVIPIAEVAAQNGAAQT